MKKQKLILCSVFSLPLILASCGATPHSHTKEKVYGDPTDDHKMTAIEKCSSCGEVFDEETVQGTWTITQAATCTTKEKGKWVYDFERFEDQESEIEETGSPLGHSYALEASGDFKKQYKVGDTFDTTNLVLKKVCEREGCNFEQVITTYTVEYAEEGQEAFAAGDDAVWLVAEGLECEVEVVVTLKTNVITGIGDKASLHCKQALDLTGVSATSGAVAVKYFDDPDCEAADEIELEEMVAGTYYAKIYSDGLDPDYEVAIKIVELTVTHDNELKPGLIIGYKDNVCKYCGNREESDTLMGDADCVFTASNSFGVNGNVQWPKDSADGSWVKNDLRVDGSIIIAHGGARNKMINLPKVDYTLFNNAVFVMKNMEAASVKIALGVTAEGAELLPKQFRTDYTVTVAYDSTEEHLEVSAADITNGVVTTTPVIIEDDDVINGVKSLAIYSNALDFEDTQCGNQLSIVKVMVNHTCSGTARASTALIGHKVIACECGRTVASDEVMETSDVDVVNNLYGATGSNNGNENTTAIVEKNANGIKLFTETTGHSGTNFFVTFGLPKVDFSLYSKVTFTLEGIDCGYIIFCINASTLYVATEPGNGLTVEVENNAGVYSYKLTGHGARGDTVIGGSAISLTDNDVISGAKGLGVNVLHNSNAQRWCYITGIELTKLPA